MIIQYGAVSLILFFQRQMEAFLLTGFLDISK